MEKEARKVRVMAAALLVVTFWMFVTKCGGSCGSGVADGFEEAEKVEGATLEYVQLSYNKKARIRCPVTPTKDFTMKQNHRFVIEGVKIAEEEELLKDSIVLVGGKLRHKNNSPIKAEDILHAEADKDKFVFKTSYGNVPVVIRAVMPAEPKPEPEPEPEPIAPPTMSHEYDEAKDVLEQMDGRRAWAIIDDSGSMGAHKSYIIRIVRHLLRETDKRLVGITWYGLEGEWDDLEGTQDELLVAIDRRRVRSGWPEYPVSALEHVTDEFGSKVDVFLLFTDDRSHDGHRPDTEGRPVIGVAIGTEGASDGGDPRKSMKKIAKFTDGAWFYIDPYRYAR